MWKFAYVLVEFRPDISQEDGDRDRGILVSDAQGRPCNDKCYLMSWTEKGQFIVFEGDKPWNTAESPMWMSAGDPRKSYDSSLAITKLLFEQNMRNIGTSSLFLPWAKQPVMKESRKVEEPVIPGFRHGIAIAHNREDHEKAKLGTFRDIMRKHLKLASQAHHYAPYFA